MRGAAVTEESGFLKIRACWNGENPFDPGALQLRLGEPAQIELPVLRAARWDEEPAVLGLRLLECGAQFVAYLVRRLRNTRTNGGADAIAACPKLLHRIDRGFDDAGERAFPAGMDSTDHAGLSVHEKYRCTVGGQNPQCNSGDVSRHRVASR